MYTCNLLLYLQVLPLCKHNPVTCTQVMWTFYPYDLCLLETDIISKNLIYKTVLPLTSNM